MKVYFLVFLLALGTAQFFNEEENGVIVLNDRNFKQVLGHYKNILIDFHAPWWGKWVRFQPQFESACKVLKAGDSSIQCAKIDADKFKDVAKEYNVGGFPTLIHFVDGEAKTYDGAMKDHSVISWMQTGETTSSLRVDLAQLEAMAESEHIFYAFLGDLGSKQYKMYSMIAKFDEHRNFVHSDDPAVIEKYAKGSPSLLAFRQFDEPVVALEEEFNRVNAIKFIREAGIATCMYFKDIDSVNIFRGKSSAVFLTIDPEKTPEIVDQFCATAREDDSNLLYAWVSVNNPDQDEIRTYVNLTDKPSPHLSIIHFDVHYGMMRYDYDSDSSNLSSEDIKIFVSRFHKGGIERQYFDDQDNEWYHVTNANHLYHDNYEEVVLNQEADVLVYYFATVSDDMEMDYFHTEIAEVSKQLGRNDDIIIAKYDWHKDPPSLGENAKENSIVLYTKEDKKKGIVYGGDRTVKGIQDFLAANSPVYQQRFAHVEDL